MPGDSNLKSLHALIERGAENNRKIAELKAELDKVEHDNKRVADALALLREMGIGPTLPEYKEPSEPETLPQRINAAILLKGRDLTGNEIIETIREHWDADVKPDNVRPTIWRLVKASRLKKKGDFYSLP